MTDTPPRGPRRPIREPQTDVAPAPRVTPSEARRAATAPPGPETDGQGAADGIAAYHEFDLDHLDARGHRWEGRFRCHVLTIDERVQVALTKARMMGGVAPFMLDPETLALLEMRAHLAVALDKAPDWMKRMGGFRDQNVVAAIYREVAQHEQRFHGSTSESPGDEDGPRP